MSRRKKSNNQVKGDETEDSLPCSDLRKVAPVRRMRGQVAVVEGSLARHHATLSSWAVSNGLAQKACDALAEVVAHIALFDDAMRALEDSGFSPPRKTFTAATKRGDRVRVLEEHRTFYADLMPQELMLDLLVTKKQPGKGGGLVVEASDKRKMRVAIAHVVRLT